MGASSWPSAPTAQFEQQVALKLVRRGSTPSSTSGRFRDERQILASLDIPTSRACSTAA